MTDDRVDYAAVDTSCRPVYTFEWGGKARSADPFTYCLLYDTPKGFRVLVTV